MAIKPIRHDLEAVDVFVGLGLNVACRNDITEYHTKAFARDINHKYFPLDFAPLTANPDKLRAMKNGYVRWLVGSGLRSLMEALIETVEGLYGVIRDVETKLAIHRNADVSKQDRGFYNPPDIKSKLERMKDNWKQDFVLRETFDCLDSIARARNALAHSAGFVKPRHCNKGDPEKLTIKWRGFEQPDIFIEIQNSIPRNADGSLDSKTIQIELIKKIADKGAGVPVMRYLSFKIGEAIDIPPEALSEIFYFFGSCSNEIVTTVVRLLNSYGVGVTTSSLLAQLQMCVLPSSDPSYITANPM